MSNRSTSGMTDFEREFARLLAAAMVARALQIQQAAANPQPSAQPESAPKRRRRSSDNRYQNSGAADVKTPKAR